MTHPFDPAPPPRSPGLEAMIRAAREQSTPVVTVQVDDIRAAASARNTVRWWGGLAAAAVVAISIWAVQPRAPAQTNDPSAVLSRVASAEEAVVPPTGQSPAEEGPVISDAQPLSSSVASIEPLEGAEEPAPSEGGIVALSSGRYRIQTTDAATVVLVVGRVLQVSAASHIVVDARVEHSSFRVVKGDAKWSKPEATPVEPGPGAKQLATEAEAALLSGRIEEAVRLLRKLVQAHPRGPATKAGLIDLARLEKRLGRPERAHCAYALFSKRFPADARTPTVRRADDALGLTPRCRGLRPISN